MTQIRIRRIQIRIQKEPNLDRSEKQDPNPKKIVWIPNTGFLNIKNQNRTLDPDQNADPDQDPGTPKIRIQSGSETRSPVHTIGETVPTLVKKEIHSSTYPISVSEQIPTVCELPVPVPYMVIKLRT